LFRAIVSTKSSEPLEVSLPKPFHLPGWQPADMTGDPSQGVLVLDTTGGISRIRNDAQGPHQEVLFHVPAAYATSSIAAGEGFVVVTSNSRAHCTLFRFTIANRSIDQKTLAQSGTCVGVAVAGSSINVVFIDSKEIGHWDKWDSPSSKRYTIQGATTPATLLFDKQDQRFLVGDRDGQLYAVPLDGGHSSKLTSGAGWIASLAANSNHILMASGKKILMILRSDNHGENPPPALRSLTGGSISGVAFDSAGNLWYSDYTNGSVSGPLTFR
jgi:hypothetical protein